VPTKDGTSFSLQSYAQLLPQSAGVSFVMIHDVVACAQETTPYEKQPCGSSAITFISFAEHATSVMVKD